MTDLQKYHDAMRGLLLIAYEDLAGIVDSNTAWTLASLSTANNDCTLDEQWRCVVGSLSEDMRGGPELRDEIEPYLEAIRAAEAVIGRHLAPTAYDWMRRLIDGEAGI